MTKPQPHSEYITIVDANDNTIGSEKRQIVSEKGLIHRIVRIIITNPQGQILMQQRAATKQDDPLKWEWSATGHVDANEDYFQAALRETSEEIGITDAKLKLIGKYYSEFPSEPYLLKRFNGVFIGQTNQKPRHEPNEVDAIRWVTPAELQDWLTSRPNDFGEAVANIIQRFGDKIYVSKQ